MRLDHPRPSALVLALAALVTVLVGACGDDEGDEQQEAQPVPGASAFQEGGFDQLPRYRGSEAISEPAIEDDVTTQSYQVTATPEQVVDWYADELATGGWVAVEGPAQRGAEETYRGVWMRDDQQLVVSVTRFTGEDTSTRAAQYSLNLGPADR